MMFHKLMVPPVLYSGQGCLAEGIREILERERAGKVLVFTDKGIMGAGLISLLLDVLKERQVEYEIFDDLRPEPSYRDVENICKQAEDSQGDLIVAFGGGSVMDAAKLCSILKGSEYLVNDLLANPGLGKKQIKLAAIPTTCGTGSEATCNAIVAIPEEEVKKGIVNHDMIPDYVILDPEVIRNLPKGIVAATGVDALAHAVECYTSKKATPLSDTYALAGAKLIFGNIREAYENPDNRKAKEAMLLGAFYGGIAITGSGTTAVHALSYPLGGKYHISHGVSNAIIFGHVMRMNREACAEQLARLCDAIHPRLWEAGQKEKADYVIREIEDIIRFTQIPTDLYGFGVRKEDLDFLVEAGSKQTRLLVNNKKELTLEDIRSIYEKVL